MKNLITTTLYVFLITLVACNAPTAGIDVELTEQEFAIPLINSRLDFNTVTENSEGTSIEVDENGLVTVKYLGDVIRREVTEIFEVQDTTYIFPVIDGVAVPLPETEDGDEVDRLIMGPTSSMWLQHTNTGSETVIATMTLPEFFLDDQPLEISVTVEPGQLMVSDTVNLDGVEVIPSTDSIAVKLEVETLAGETVPTFLSTIAYLDNFDVRYLEGLIVERVYPDLADEFIVVGLFENWISGNAQFVDPKFTVEVVNGFGTPVSAIFNEMSITTVEGQTLDLESTLIDEGISVTYPTLDMVGETTRSAFAFDKDNSNIEDLFGRRPERVTYDIEALVNPNSAEDQGFLDRSSFFQIDIALEVPLEGSINDFVIEADAELDIATLDDAASATFKVIFENSFPMDMFSQIYFLDDNSTVVDSLFAEGTTRLASGVVGSDGRVTEATSTILEIPFDDSRLDHLLRATSIDIAARFDSPDTAADGVGIYDDNALVVKMGARIILD